ncbi:MAG: tRNA (guanosine(46)-N7)-methyltransferase TrmB [Tenericutes bacterium]|nr:tRNA (guanosine(46)-N7)-methyltransferase TrmB [Mycoplasmatota bacterium]
MRLKHIKNAEFIVESSPYVIDKPEDNKGFWNKVFNNNNPIEIEIGMGKGKYIIEKARQNKNINYIGIEKYDSPLVNAIKILNNENLDNLRIICFDAYNIDTIFDNEISKIYLNFSDPWPKKRHTKRRLTSNIYLSKYDKVFKDEKSIEMKTDNDDLYEYSLISFEENGYEIIKTDTNYKDTITTEYEDKFISTGKNINYVYVVKK